MVTRFDDWEGEFLAHHGIKGQKWGIRRFQNPDGTLTEAGRKRVAQSGSYLEIDRRRAAKHVGRINSDHKQRVLDEYNKEYWKQHDNLYDRPHSTNARYKKLFDSFKEKYASATLKDLGYKNTMAGRKQVRAILKEVSADWDNPDPSWSDYKAASKRRNELMHPTRTKAKAAAKKTAEIIGAVRKVTG